MLKKYLKLSIVGTTILTTLSSSGVFAGHGVAMPGVLQKNGAEGRLFNGSNNIVVSTGKDKGTDLLYTEHSLLDNFGLEPLSNFKRGIKKFITSGKYNHLKVRLDNPSQYHYSDSDYSGEQEVNDIYGRGRDRVYGVWEANGGKYNLYDAAGGKWGDCVPYYISGSNRYNRMHNGWDWAEHKKYLLSDSTTKKHYDNIHAKTVAATVREDQYPEDKRYYIYDIQMPASSKEFYTPNFLGKYAYEELGMQMYIPYVVNDQGQRQSKINLISNAGHLNGDLNPDQVDFTFSFY